MDDVYGGEHLLAAVYAAIRNSPYWNTSLLIITYDEHGGVYDSVNPPGGAPAPGDNPSYGYSTHGFTFEQYGVRVPAIIVSPLVPAGTVDHTLYDHSSCAKHRLNKISPGVAVGRFAFELRAAGRAGLYPGCEVARRRDHGPRLARAARVGAAAEMAT
jgi:phospholipase C